jgi:hypothetical protein
VRRVKKRGGGWATAGAKPFEIVHDKLGTETGASRKDEIGLESPGDRVGASDVASAPAMRN